jgi:hypothetical protein
MHADSLDGYTRLWQFQLVAFAVLRLPLFLLALVVIFFIPNAPRREDHGRT